MKKYIVPQNKGFSIGFFQEGLEPSNAIDPENLELPTVNAVHWVYENGEFSIDQASFSLEKRSKLQALTKRQFALALDDYGKYDEVMTLLESDRRAKIEFDSVSNIERLSPTVVAMTALLAVSDTYVDEFFEYAQLTYP